MSDFVDRLPPGDRAAVEHQAVGQSVVVDHARGHGQMLPFALGIGEAEVDPVDLLVLDPRKDRARVGRLGHCLNSLLSVPLGAGIIDLKPAKRPPGLLAVRGSDGQVDSSSGVQIPEERRRVRRGVRISPANGPAKAPRKLAKFAPQRARASHPGIHRAVGSSSSCSMGTSLASHSIPLRLPSSTMPGS